MNKSILRFQIFSRPARAAVTTCMILFVLQSALSNTYTPTTFTDFPITGMGISVNNANGVITGGAGNGQVTLRSAIAAANNVAGPHTINLSTGTYTLTIPGTGEGIFPPDITKGDLDVTTNNVTIHGLGMNSTIINQTSGIDRVFDVNVNFIADFNFTIDNLTISGGREQTGNGGGGMFTGSSNNLGTVTITNVKFDNNQAFQAMGFMGSGFGGGGLQHQGGHLVLSGCVFNNNSTTKSGGALCAFGYQDPISNPMVNNNMTVTNCTFTNNTCNGASGGGAIDFFVFNLTSSTVTVTGCTFSGNSSTASGGGAIVNESANVTVTKSTFLNNQGTAGGGMHVGGGSTSVSFCRFFGNTATTGNQVSVAGASVILTANNNWWGVHTGPGVNDAVAAGGAILNLTHWLTLTHTPGSNEICPNTSTSLTASVLQNSAGSTIALSDLVVLIGQPISFTNVLPAGSTVTNAQTTIQANAMATATFNSGSTPGPGGANAVVDNASVHAAITVLAPPVVTLHPMSQAVCIDVPISFMSTATGNPTPTIQWQRSTDGGMSFQNLMGETTSTLAFTTVFEDDGNQYRAEFTNICEVVNSNAATLTVYPDEDPDFAYAKTGYCQMDTDPLPVIYGTPGGIFSAPVQLSINTATGLIDVSASTEGGPYTITYNTNGPCPEIQTFDVSIVNCIPGATLTDAFSIDNGQIGAAEPGDRIMLTATISNAQVADYETVQLSLIANPAVTLVSGSFKSTPIAVNDAYLGTLNTVLNIATGSGVLVNDFDEGSLSVTSFSNPTTEGGTVTVNANGSFTYMPPSDFTGYDSFTYTITDADSQSDTATVNIKVQ